MVGIDRSSRLPGCLPRAASQTCHETNTANGSSAGASGTGGGANYSNYSSADFDQLLAGASAASSTAEKARSVAKAERLVLDQMALVPLWYNTEFRVFKHARWKGLAIDFWGNPTLASATSA